MTKQSSTKIGRPAGQKHHVGVRLSAPLLRKVREAASLNECTVAEEITRRLGASFDGEPIVEALARIEAALSSAKK